MVIFIKKWTQLTRETKNTEEKIFQESLFLLKPPIVDKFYIDSMTVTVIFLSVILLV